MTEAASTRSQPPPLVSVVTTAYNEERYLSECIESVLAQTYSHWEYTIVDNASTDRTGEIALEYAARDPRIRVVRNAATIPALANLNAACRQVSPNAKYVKIVAGDDWIFSRCIEEMVDVAEANPRVAIVGAYRATGKQIAVGGLPFDRTVASGREVCRTYMTEGVYPFGVPTSLLYRAELMRGREAFFDERYPEADVMACLEHLQAHDFGFVHQVLTFMREQGETSHSVVQKYNLYLGENLRCMVMYGPKYFDAAELSGVITNHLKRYYEYLGREALKRPEREFWALHQKMMAEQGYPMNRLRVAAYAFLSLIEGAARRIRRRL